MTFNHGKMQDSICGTWSLWSPSRGKASCLINNEELLVITNTTVSCGFPPDPSEVGCPGAALANLVSSFHHQSARSTKHRPSIFPAPHRRLDSAVGQLRPCGMTQGRVLKKVAWLRVWRNSAAASQRSKWWTAVNHRDPENAQKSSPQDTAPGAVRDASLSFPHELSSRFLGGDDLGLILWGLGEAGSGDC